MPRFGLLLVAILPLALGAGLGFSLSREKPGARPVPAAEATDQSAQIALLARQVRELQARTSQRSDVEGKPAASAVVEPEPRAAAPVAPSREERLQLLDDRLQTEPRDAGWARATEQRISEAMAFDAASSAKLEEVQCASTLCRIKIATSSPEEAPALMQLIQEKTPFLPHGTIQQVALPDGTTHVLAYAALEGHPLNPTR
jgi:hypothetical protein